MLLSHPLTWTRTSERGSQNSHLLFFLPRPPRAGSSCYFRRVTRGSVTLIPGDGNVGSLHAPRVGHDRTTCSSAVYMDTNHVVKGGTQHHKFVTYIPGSEAIAAPMPLNKELGPPGRPSARGPGATRRWPAPGATPITAPAPTCASTRRARSTAALAARSDPGSAASGPTSPKSLRPPRRLRGP